MINPKATRTASPSLKKKQRYFNQEQFGFIVIPAEFLLDKGMTFSQLRVLLTLARYADATTGFSSVSVETICECTGMARENVSRTLSHLHSRGWIIRKRMGQGFNNTYTIKIRSDSIRQTTDKKRSDAEQAIHNAAIARRIVLDIEKGNTSRNLALGEAEPDWHISQRLTAFAEKLDDIAISNDDGAPAYAALAAAAREKVFAAELTAEPPC